MRSIARPLLPLVAGALVLALAPGVLAHGDDEGGMNMGAGAEPDVKPDEASYAPTYFAHPEHRGAIIAHIAIMVAAWVFVLPTAVMLSLARSRYTLGVQFVFLVANAFGVLVGTIYNANTPDLYPNNAHHKLGWIVTWVVSAQVIIGLLGRLAGQAKGKAAQGAAEGRAFIPVSQENMEEHERMHGFRFPKLFRHSNDSGQGTEPHTGSSRSQSVSTLAGTESPSGAFANAPSPQKEYDDDEEEEDVELNMPMPSPPRGGKVHSLARKAAGMISTRAWKFLMFGYHFVDRAIMPLGFIALCTGIIAYGRFFEGHQIFTGLAHWIKGGIFFWLGLFTLGRWSGSFGEVGWAWNVRPRSIGQKWRPSAEFCESALIFFYGITNIFLEHLANAGDAYSAQDLEHVSITVLFIGGGLCGMLIESTFVRDLMNTTVTEAAHEFPEHSYQDEARDELRPPKSYSFSINPIPALVILLLGIMMSSHTQTGMVSSMVHKQWGNLLTGASFARGFTYVIMYLKPPTSILPSRPPTELLASFGLITGGIIFMASSGDTVDAMVHYDLDAMFMYTVTMGFSGLLMAWEIILLALKGWAVRRESGRPTGSYRMA